LNHEPTIVYINIVGIVEREIFLEVDVYTRMSDTIYTPPS